MDRVKAADLATEALTAIQPPDLGTIAQFDERWYLDSYPDVAAAVAQGACASGLAHFQTFGRVEGRRGSDADLGGRVERDTAPLDLTLDTNSEERRQKINAAWSTEATQRASVCGWYWMAHPMVVERINTFISGDPRCDAYSRLEWLLRQRGWKLPIERAASLGCGFGDLERDLARRGLICDMDAYDLAESAIEGAQRLACDSGLNSIRYHVADLDNLNLAKLSLDAVFAHQAVHHVSNLESLYSSVRDALRPGGIFHLHEFVGPSRFQWTEAQLAAVNEYLISLPPHLRRLPDGRAKPLLYRPTLAAMIAADPSEAVRSADILTTLYPLFEVIERCEIGGTLLHLALGDIAQNFDMGEPVARRHLELLFELEDKMLANGSIGSDFVVVTAVPRRADACLIS